MNINGAGSSTPAELTPFAGRLYFVATDIVDGRELWRTDGTTTEQAADIDPAGDSLPEGLHPFGDRLYFTARDPAFGVEPWRTDGFTTERVADINPGVGDSAFQSEFATFGGALYFRADDGATGTELWRTDGATTTRVADINPGAGDSNPGDLVVFDNALHFSANDGTAGAELWRTDGTSAQPLAEINPGAGASNPSSVTVFESALYLSADEPAAGREPWRIWRALSLEATAKRKQKLRKRVSLGVTCDVACDLVAKGRLTVKGPAGKAGPRKRKFGIRRKQVELGADQPLALKLRLRKRGLRKARSALETRGGRAKAKLKVVATGPGGDVVGEQLRVRLR